MTLERAVRALRWLLSLALVIGLSVSCSEPGAPPTAGSETHFLMDCDSSCDAGMACICGVCSAPCVELTDCKPLASAATCSPLAPRVAQGRCDVAPLGAMCDVGCLTDDDCSSLSSESRCVTGFCRESAPEREDPLSCVHASVVPEDVLVWGDVSVELTIFTEQLERAAVAGGSLAEGAHYRNEANAGSSLLATGPLSFDAQYTTLRESGIPRVVIMNGGATDLLNDSCAAMLTLACPAASAAIDGAEQLFSRFARDGVDQLVFFFYGDPIDNPSKKASFDLLRPLLQNACGRSPVPCHFLDLRPIFEGHPEYVDVDGYLFSPQGATAAAQAVYELMQARCVAN